MAEPSQHINYSFEDIQRYLQGKMPAAEMHAIEKAALQDPFLADAIEGFNEADLTTAGKHLNEINAGLFAEKKESKVVAFNKRMRWLNVAAIMIVLAGIGVVISYFAGTSSRDKQTEIAKVQQAPAENESINDSISALANSDALTKKEDTGVVIAQNKPAKNSQSPIPKRKEDEKIIIAENKASKQDRTGTDKKETASMLAAAPASDLNTTPGVTDTAEYVFKTNPPPVEEKQMIARSYAAPDTSARFQGKVSGVAVLPSPATFSGKVVDENNKPIAGVTIQSADAKAAVLTDINGNFNLQTNDTLLHVTASTVGYDSRAIALRQGFNKPFVLQQNNAALNEVVVVGYGTKRQKNKYADSLELTKSKSSSDSAMPVNGWNNFNNYVITQLNKDTTMAAITDPRDMVELEFLVDNAGNPYNIKITRPLDEQHNAKAVELLKNGPKWTTPSRKKKAKVVINF